MYVIVTSLEVACNVKVLINRRFFLSKNLILIFSYFLKVDQLNILNEKSI